LRTGFCNTNQTRDGCISISESAPVELKIFDGAILCIKRDPEINFYKIDRPVKKSIQETNITTMECEEGYKLCGSPISQGEYQTCIRTYK
jgi:hypothetical protein